MNKKYFETKTGSIEEKITQIATEQQSINKPESNVKLKVEKTYFDVKPGSISDVASKIVEGLDPVNKNAVKKKFDDRKDKDIDNDGDVDSTDKYLHTRRSAISKNIKEDEKKCPTGMYYCPISKTCKPISMKEGKDFEPHMMYDPKTGKAYKANKPEDHTRMAKIGYTHEKPKKEAVMPDDKGEKINQMKHKLAKKGEKEIVKLKEVDNPYAVGMSQAMKSTGDKPPLKKSTITKAHDIAKGIMKKEEICPKCGKDHSNKINASNCGGMRETKSFSQLRTETKVIKLGDKGKTVTGKQAAAVDVEPSSKPI